jgi:inosine/xanthosine triphosphatase
MPPQLSAFAHVVVGSTNPVKIAAVRAVVSRIAPDATVEGVAVASGVPDQPIGDDETQAGARQRAIAAHAARGGTLGIGLEGGVVRLPDGGMRSCAWAIAIDAHGVEGVGGSLAMPLPAAVVRRINAGEELGHAMDALAQTVGTKHGRGAVGILTGGLIDRQAAYEQLVTYALSVWIAAEYY